MIKKLKSKIFRGRSGVLGVLGLVFALGLLVLSFTFTDFASAKDEKINPKSIGFKTQVFIEGKEDNLIRMLEGPRADSVEFKAIVAITSASNSEGAFLSSIDLGSDILDFEASGSFDRTISEFGVGLNIVGEGDTCGSREVTDIIPILGNDKKFTACTFVSISPSAVKSGQVKIGVPYEFTFSLNSSIVQKLILNRPCLRNATDTACFSVLPYFNLDKAGRDAKIAGVGAGKDIYVQFFDKLTELNQARANDLRPNDIPAYSSNEGGLDVSRVGSGLVGLINQVIGILLGLLSEITYQFFSFLVAPTIESVLSIRSYTDSFAAVIYPGWELVRNVSNIFFIVALIVIGLATLLRLSNYQFKHLLVQLIIAALLVNFSLVIGQAVLAIADTVQQQFLPNSSGAIRNLGHQLMVSYRSTVWEGFFNLADKGYFANLIQHLFFLALSLGSFMVFLAIGAFLVIRIVMLWILLMVSPIAYVAGVLPATTKYRSQWWSTFLKYAFFTPIMAFFLNMAAYIAVTYNKIPVLQKVLDDPSVISPSADSLSAFVFKVSSNIMLLVFLIVALKISESFGIYGASAISNIAKKGIFAPFALTGKGIKLGAGFATEKIHEKTGVQLNPKKWIEGFKESREINKRRREAAGMAKAEGRSVLGNPTSFFQRYWSPSGIWRAVSRGNIEGKKLQQEAVELFEKSKAKRREGDDKEADRLMELARSRELEAFKKLHPVDYLTQQKVRHGVHEEKGNLHAETWEELVSYANGALRENNLTRYLAVAQKLSETYNENELVTHTYYPRAVKANECAEWEEMETDARKVGLSEAEIERMGNEILHDKGDTFDSSREGMRNFSKFVLRDKFGLSAVAARNYLADITDIAEHQGHWGIARIIGNEAGMPVEKTDEESEEEAEAEKGKIDVSQKYTRWNRLAHCDELTATDYMISGVRFPILQNSSANDIIKNIQNIKFMLGRGYLGVSNARAFSFTANLAKLQGRADQIDPTRKMDLLDRGGNVMTYQKDVVAGSKESLDGLAHFAGDKMEVYAKKYVEGVIEDMKQQAGEHWGKNKIEMRKSEQALLGRVNAGKMPPKHMKSLTYKTSTKGAYLEPTGVVVKGKVQYRINPNWATPPPTAGASPPASATGTPTSAPTPPTPSTP